MPKYFLAVLPPKSISNEIVDFQKELERKFGCVHAQKAPPHITVVPPFDCSEEKLELFVTNIVGFLNDKSTIDTNIHLDSFQRFESRTLFVDVAKNEKFETFCKDLKTLFNRQRIMKKRVEKHYFVPHITLANKDIKKRDFKTAWTELKNREYQRSFTLTNLNVLELVKDNWFVKRNISTKVI